MPIFLVPLFPVDVPPVLNNSTPLLPLPPLLALAKMIDPLLDIVPSPLTMQSCPPVLTELLPKIKLTEAPIALAPLPAPTITVPALPPVATEEPIKIAPEFPFVDAPELKTRQPLDPDRPELELRRLILPLLVAVPSPLSSKIDPPLVATARPAMTLTPALPLVPLPITTCMLPLVPLVAAPDPKATKPLLPEIDVPELNVKEPLELHAPAFALMTRTTPLDVAVPSPLKSRIGPPVKAVLHPPNAAHHPPAPDVPLPTVNKIAPLLPSVLELEPAETSPVFPHADDPELNVSRPLKPEVPPFAVKI